MKRKSSLAELEAEIASLKGHLKTAYFVIEEWEKTVEDWKKTVEDWEKTANDSYLTAKNWEDMYKQAVKDSDGAYSHHKQNKARILDNSCLRVV